MEYYAAIAELLMQLKTVGFKSTLLRGKKRPADAPTAHPDDSQCDQIQALLTALETTFHLIVDYSHCNVELCNMINLLNDRVIAGLWLINPTASFASTEVTQAVTAADDLYRKGLNEFNYIERDLCSVGLE